jgi:aconitate hydratase
MVRGTFANIRLRNRLLVPETEGPVTEHLPTGERLSIYDAAERYRAEGTPLIVVAGKEYGSGSSRDWAAKGTLLLGVRAVIAESYERIHRSNLVGMGVLPLQFLDGESLTSHGLSGLETFSIRGLADLQPRQTLTVEALSNDGTPKTFDVVVRVDGPVELTYLRHGASCRWSSAACSPRRRPSGRGAVTSPLAGAVPARASWCGTTTRGYEPRAVGTRKAGCAGGSTKGCGRTR